MGIKEKMMNAEGITPKDFEPRKIDNEERLEAIEEAIIELADMLLGGAE